MNEDTMRENIDKKLTEMGYKHPSETHYNSNPQYMAYNTDYVPYSHQTYLTYNETISTKRLNTSTCPVCDTKALYGCDCEYNDMLCKNGHTWYVTQNGYIKTGDPHEK